MRSPYIKEHTVWGSILGDPYLGKLSFKSARDVGIRGTRMLKCSRNTMTIEDVKLCNDAMMAWSTPASYSRELKSRHHGSAADSCKRLLDLHCINALDL